MKKTLTFTLFSLLIVPLFSYASDCSSYLSSYNSIKSQLDSITQQLTTQLKNAGANDGYIASYIAERTQTLSSQANSAYISYSTCYNQNSYTNTSTNTMNIINANDPRNSAAVSQLQNYLKSYGVFQQGYNAYNNGDYQSALYYYQQYINMGGPDVSSANYNMNLARQAIQNANAPKVYYSTPVYTITVKYIWGITGGCYTKDSKGRKVMVSINYCKSQSNSVK